MEAGVNWFMILDFVGWLLSMVANAATAVIAIGVTVIAYRMKKA